MDVFDEMFGTFESFAFRVETLPVYKIEGGEWEEFNNFQQGLVFNSFANQDWVDQISSWKNSGKQIKRIRVLPPKLNAYLRYEIEWCYPKNFLAGEEFRFVSQRTYNTYVTSETKGDYWLFDNNHVLLMKYDEEGSYIGEELINGNQSCLPYIKLFEKLDKVAIPMVKILMQIRTSRIDLELL